MRSSLEKRIHPPEDVLVAHHTSHALHARAALGVAHAEYFQNGVGYLLHVVGIYQHRAGLELLGCACELAEDQHAVVFIHAACAVLFGYQVHAVLERRNQRDFARTVVGQQIVAIKAAKTIMHRQPGVGREPAVDVTDQTIDAVLEFVIPGNLYSTRHNILDQDHATSQLPVTLQRVAERAQALGNSFAIVEAVRT